MQKERLVLELQVFLKLLLRRKTSFVKQKTEQKNNEYKNIILFDFAFLYYDISNIII